MTVEELRRFDGPCLVEMIGARRLEAGASAAETPESDREGIE